MSRAPRTSGQGAADRGQYRQAAQAIKPPLDGGTGMRRGGLR
jgi:hypothetical protein